MSTKTAYWINKAISKWQGNRFHKTKDNISFHHHITSQKKKKHLFQFNTIKTTKFIAGKLFFKSKINTYLAAIKISLNRES